MSFIAHDDLHASHQAEILSAHHRAILRRVLERAVTVFIGLAIVAAAVTAMVGFKVFIVLSRMPLLP